MTVENMASVWSEPFPYSHSVLWWYHRGSWTTILYLMLHFGKCFESFLRGDFCWKCFVTETFFNKICYFLQTFLSFQKQQHFARNTWNWKHQDVEEVLETFVFSNYQKSLDFLEFTIISTHPLVVTRWGWQSAAVAGTGTSITSPPKWWPLPQAVCRVNTIRTQFVVKSDWNVEIGKRVSTLWGMAFKNGGGIQSPRVSNADGL